MDGACQQTTAECSNSSAPRRLPPNAGKGRKAGVPNRVNAAAREAFELAFKKIGGPKSLADWAKDNQTDFYKLYARLIPVEAQVNADGKIIVEIRSFGGADANADTD